MNIEDIKVGETYRYGFSGTMSNFHVTIKGAEKMVLGYFTDAPENETYASVTSLFEIPKRWEVVAYRKPKTGEHFANARLDEEDLNISGMEIQEATHDFRSVKCLIVKEIPT